MLKIKNKLIIALVIAWSLTVTPSIAEITIGEGYAKATFKELYQTMVVMGGIDVSKPEFLTEYIKLTYCDLYKKYYHDDVRWNKISTEVYSNIADRKENYRIMYEFVEYIKLGRYDFNGEFFELHKKSKMRNVGTILLLDYETFKPYCYVKDEEDLFPIKVTLILTEPMNISRLEVPSNKIEQLLDNIADEEGQDNKAIYARVRFKILDVPGIFFKNGNAKRSEVRGTIKDIDFFYDMELTKNINFVKIKKLE